MPPVLAAVIAAAGVTGAVSIGAATISYATILANVIFTGALVGAQFLFRQQQKTPTREPLKNVLRQSAAPRFMAYGRVRSSGVVYFWDAIQNIFCMGIAFGHGRISEVRGLYIDGALTTWSTSTGAITSGPLNNYASVHFTTGLQNIIPGPIIATYFPSIWGATHLLKGVPYMEMSIARPPEKQIRSVLPNGIPQNIRIEYDGAMVYDPRDGAHVAGSASAVEWYHPTWEWSDNPALCILDYLRHPDGGRLPITWLDVPSFEEAADYCDALVATNGSGGTEKRYRLWGIVSLDEPVRDALARMLATCDGELYHAPDGKIALRLGQYRAPTLIFDEGSIRALSLEQGNGRLAAYNTVRVKYTEPAQDFQIVEGPTVTNPDAFDATGVEISEEITVGMCPSATQAHRLALRKMRKGNAKNRITLETDMTGLLAIGEPSVGVDVTIGGFNIDTEFEVRSLTVSPDMSSVTMELQQAVAGYSDEGYPAVTHPPVTPPTPASIETPTGLTAAVVRVVTTMGETLTLRAAVNSPADPSLVASFEARQLGAPTWGLMANVDDVTGTLAGVADSVVYEVRARFADPAGRTGAWSATVEATTTSTIWRAETRQAISRMPTRPDDARGDLLDAFVGALVDAGVWAKLDALYLLAAHSADAARINLVSASWPLTQVGTVDFDADLGFAGDGSTGYHSTGFNPTTATAPKFLRDDAHMGVWSLTDGVGAHDMGAGNSSLGIMTSSGTFQTRGNTGLASGSGMTNALGHLCWSRPDASNLPRYRDGALHSNTAQASVALSNYVFRVGGYVTSTASFSARRLALAHFGGSLTAGEVAALHAAADDYLTAIGAI